MIYSKEKNGIAITETSSFDPKHIFDCGQIFRYTEQDGVFTVFSADKKAVVKRTENGYFITTDFPDYFVNYFDLSKDYENIKKAVAVNEIMQKSVDFGSGIRILKQNFYEMVISFIISANNHIPRIKGIIGRLATTLGENMGDYFAFPTMEALASKDEKFYAELGAGYRAEYIAKTSHTLAETDPDEFLSLPTPELRKKLLGLLGVGPKVADCILLFGAGRTDVFPVDTWIEKVFHDYFGTAKNNAGIRQYFLDLFGENAGYAQQYVFYYKRELERKF